MNIELYQKYFRKNNKGLVLLILIIGVGTVVNGLNPYIYGKIIDSISGKNIIILKKWLLCLGIVLIVTLILETVESLIGNWLTNIIENQIKNDLFAHITISGFVNYCRKYDHRYVSFVQFIYGKIF